MRKILALILVMTIAVVFAACGDKGEDQTTLNPLNTAYAPITSGNQQSGNNTGATGATYILTTVQGKTVPTLNTTRFSYDVAASVSGQQTSSTTNNYDNVSYTTTGGVITVPNATTTRTISTTWQTLPSTTIPTSPVVTTTGRTTKAPTPTTTQPTTNSGPEGVYVVVNDTYTDNDGRVCVAIDSEGWGSKIKSNSQRIPVYIDGVEMEEGAMLQISSSTTGDGYQSVYLNLGDYEIDTGSSTITFTIPEGFLENKTGTKYNYAYEVSM